MERTNLQDLPKPELGAGYFIHHRPRQRSFRQFCVRGERSTGTHYLTAIVNRYTELVHLDTGWKHGMTFREEQPLHDQLVILCIVRDWRSWLKSMFRKPWHASAEVHALDFSNFLRHPWEGYHLKGCAANGQPARSCLLQDDRHPITGLPFGNIFDLRNTKHRFLFGLGHRHHAVMIVKYEWLMGRETEFLGLLASEFDVETRPFHPITHRFAANYGSFQHIQRDPPPEEFAPLDEAFILSQLDAEMERRLGYI